MSRLATDFKSNPINAAYATSLRRFRDAYEWDLETAIAETSDAGRTVDGRWVWGVFPCLRGRFGKGSALVSIADPDEARRFLDDEILGDGIRQATASLISTGRPVEEMFRYSGLIDQLHASLTLFSAVAGQESVFGEALTRLFGARQDMPTLALLEQAVAS